MAGGELPTPSRETIGGYIERRLGIEGAALLSPLDLAQIGAAVWAGDEVNPVVGNPDYLIEETYKLIKKRFPDFDKSFNTFSVRYRELIGNGIYREGMVAQALDKAASVLSEAEYQRLLNTMGSGLGELLATSPYEFNMLPPPAIRMNPKTNSMTFWGVHHFPMPFFPRTIVEYGPGIVGVKKLKHEYTAASQIIMVENGQYKISVLTMFGGLNGIVYPQLITRRDGMKSATHAMLAVGAQNTQDAIIAGNIHGADPHEVKAGIIHGYELLRRGGLFTLAGPADVFGDEVGISTMITQAETVFRNPPVFQAQTITISETTGVRRLSKGVVFVK
ncbi:hypothetical protein HY468_03970 [Candidatus Roizmanbacteria bacterium]|nr:hypothetical protein [Candidatus Roizmanbacteria bacterium]